MVGNPVAQGHDGQDRIEATIGDMQTAVGNEQIVDLVHLPETVGNRGLGVIAHAAGAGLMLAAAQTQAQPRPPDPYRAGFLDDGLGLGGEEFADLKVVQVPGAGKAADGNSPVIGDGPINTDTS